MKSIIFCTLHFVSICVLGVLVGIATIIAEEIKTNSFVEILSTSTMMEIDAEYRKLKALAGTKVLNVRAVVGSAKVNQLVLHTDQIFLQMSQGTKSELVGIGLLDNSSNCAFEIVKGFETASLKLWNASGTSLTIGRQDKKKSVKIIFDQIPSEFCFAFIVPVGAKGLSTFHFDDDTAPLTLP